MKWKNVKKHKIPTEGRILTYSDCYRNKPEAAYRIIDAQFIKLCGEITHFIELEPPKIKERKIN